MNTDTEWYKNMLAKYGSEEKIREVMQANSNKSSRNSKGTGGFRFMKVNNPERLNEIAKLGGVKRWEKK